MLWLEERAITAFVLLLNQHLDDTKFAVHNAAATVAFLSIKS